MVYGKKENSYLQNGNKKMTKPLITLYTHTDAKDVWSAWYGQYQKYLNDYDLCLCVNSGVDIGNEPIAQHQIVYYNNEQTYTQRLDHIMKQLGERTILFLHEDMILYSEVDHERIEEYTQLIENDQAKSIKLIYAGDMFYLSSVHDELVKNDYSKFSIQPTIIKTQTLLKILNNVGNLNIWDFENAIVNNDGHYMAKVGGETKRGMFHFDSMVFPYIATAIVKGKWNMSEYPSELGNIFSEYKIDPQIRGNT